MYFEQKIYSLLNESDQYKAKSKETGKVVTFKSKDAMDAAVKGGSHEPLDKPAGGGSEDKPKGQSVFDPQKPADEPSPDKTGEPVRDEEAVKDALEGVEEGLYDAMDRDMDYGDPDVADMVRNDVQTAIDAGATTEDFKEMARRLDSVHDRSMGETLDDALFDLTGESPIYGHMSPGERDTKGSDNPYDKGDEYHKDPMIPDNEFEDDGTLGDLHDDDMDQGIEDAIEGIRPEYREKAFDMIIQSLDDDYDLEEIYTNLEAGKLPKPDEDPYGAIKHRIIMQGIEDGTIDFGSKGMELANYIETREEDLYQQMTEGKHFVKPLIQERRDIKKMLRKRAGIL